MYNKLATLEPLINSIKQHPVQWAVGSLAVKGVPTAAVIYEVRKKKKNQKEGTSMGTKNKFFIEGLKSALEFSKTAGVIRGIPDCTGPYGRGLGPGRGRADGTGLSLLQQPGVTETLEELINRREKEQEILKHLLNTLKKNNK
jgi:hypothetical protein